MAKNRTMKNWVQSRIQSRAIVTARHKISPAHTCPFAFPLRHGHANSPALKHHGICHSSETANATCQGMDRNQEIKQQLEELKSEHRDLDEAIARIAETSPFDQLHIQRLKKRKLFLKDQIGTLKEQLLPDIIA